MGTGASALPVKVPKDDEDECEDEVAGCGDYEEEDVEFPVDTVKKYARGEEEQAKAQRVIAEWVRQKSTDHEEVEAEAEEILKDALSAFVSLKPEMYLGDSQPHPQTFRLTLKGSCQGSLEFSPSKVARYRSVSIETAPPQWKRNGGKPQQ